MVAESKAVEELDCESRCLAHSGFKTRRSPEDIWISLPYATFLLMVAYGKITEAPPIARWTTGKTVDYVMRYYARKGAEIIRI